MTLNWEIMQWAQYSGKAHVKITALIDRREAEQGDKDSTFETWQAYETQTQEDR